MIDSWGFFLQILYISGLPRVRFSFANFWASSFEIPRNLRADEWKQVMDRNLRKNIVNMIDKRIKG